MSPRPQEWRSRPAQAGWPGWRGGAPEGEQPGMSARHRAHGTHKECLVIADGEMPEDLALHADGGVHQQRCPRGTEPPVDRGELVDQVTRLLAEQAGDAYLILTQEMQAHSRKHARRRRRCG